MLPLIDHARAVLIEALWWIQLGVDLEFFPEIPALNELRDSQIMVNDKGFRARREPLLGPGFFDVVDSSSVSGGTPWTQYVRAPEALRSVFQELLIKFSNANNDSALQQFSATINFESESNWKDLIGQKLGGVGVAAARTEVAVVTGLSARGFSVGLDFMATVRETAESVISNPEVDEPDGYMFVRRIAGMTRWRFGLFVNTIDRRFDDVAEIVFDEINSTVADGRLTADDKYAYLQRIRLFSQDWRSWGGSANAIP